MTMSPELHRILLSISLGALAGVLLALLLSLFLRLTLLFFFHHHHHQNPPIFSPNIDPKSLHLALNSPLTIQVGPTYSKTILDSGLTVAVKRIDRLNGNSRKVELELELMSKLRHRNIMSLRGYFRGPAGNGLLLVYDYMATGSLADLMVMVWRGEARVGWEDRLRVAVGVVKGLEFLHFGCDPRVLHCNMKPSNVMLDGGFEARLGDIGIAQGSGNGDENANEDRDGNSAAFMAPESCLNSRYTDKSDIYSFGVILAMLLTGKNPTDPFFLEAGNGGSISRWLRQLQHAGEARQALDRSMILDTREGTEVEEEMLMAVRIAVVCMSDYQADRPSSDELVPMLTQLHSF
ncbi:hypothetical protein Drorol1_Dr00018399 [Drosera rotundifolia]